MDDVEIPVRASTVPIVLVIVVELIRHLCTLMFT